MVLAYEHYEEAEDAYNNLFENAFQILSKAT